MSPFRCPAVVLIRIFVGCRQGAELSPDGERDKRAGVTHYQHALKEQLLDPGWRHLGRPQWPDPLPKLGLVSLSDGRGEPQEIADLGIEAVLFRHIISPSSTDRGSD
jgi:hypothetical protein